RSAVALLILLLEQYRPAFAGPATFVDCFDFERKDIVKFLDAHFRPPDPESLVDSLPLVSRFRAGPVRQSPSAANAVFRHQPNPFWSRQATAHANAGSIPRRRKKLPLAFRPQAPHSLAMQTSKPKVTFEPVQKKKGKGWCVRVLFPHGPQPEIDG